MEELRGPARLPGENRWAQDEYENAPAKVYRGFHSATDVSEAPIRFSPMVTSTAAVNTSTYVYEIRLTALFRSRRTTNNFG